MIQEQNQYSGAIYILDAMNLKRGLLLFQQIQDLGTPLLLVVNQIDEAEKRGIHINFELLSQQLNTKIIQTNAKEKIGLDELREAVHQNCFTKSESISFEILLILHYYQ